MPKDETGVASFTLVEVLISAVLMLLALALLLSAFVSSKRSVVLSQTRLTAMQIACSKAEQLMTNAYTNIGPATATLTNAGIKYTITNSVATNSVTTNLANIYKNITITVKWVAPDSSRSQALTNYMTLCNTN